MLPFNPLPWTGWDVRTCGAIRRGVSLLGCAVALAAANAPLVISDLDGNALTPFAPRGKANILFFISHDCPISNSYAPEVQRICSHYGGKGVGCLLVYEDLNLAVSSARKHFLDYQYRGIPAVIDGLRKLATKANASVTPQAVVIDPQGNVRYRGRIDNFYSDFGKSRRQVTVHDATDALDDLLAGRPVANPETKAFGCYIVSPDILRR
jgi:hypothetical protein